MLVLVSKLVTGRETLVANIGWSTSIREFYLDVDDV
jgi:hypothetical protein